jgi:hypothetical protein
MPDSKWTQSSSAIAKPISIFRNRRTHPSKSFDWRSGVITQTINLAGFF